VVTLIVVSSGRDPPRPETVPASRCPLRRDRPGAVFGEGHMYQCRPRQTSSVSPSAPLSPSSGRIRAESRPL